ncbi:MAG: 3-oxoacyl-[acyl-carrier-protein] reductase [Candidatus Peribacteraceae bacterium]|nr:3-oxoacyl-[acyl-carrier-protein] reductase [Candidatus Peribacteraceae bacterium]
MTFFVEGESQEAPKGKILKNQVALVTGGSRGIGRATVLALAQAGAHVIINYQRNTQQAYEVCAAAEEFGVRAEVIQADVSDQSQAEGMIRRALDEFPRIDILVNNAGITRDKSFVKMSRMHWDEVLDVNLTGVFHVTHAVLPGMLAAGYGRIVNVASIVGQTGSFGQTNFAAAKGALIAFTKSLAREVARKGITVNAVSPGYIETDMMSDVPDKILDGVRAATPIGRLGKPEEVAAAIAFLAQPQSSYITGHVLAVNGGMYM